MTIFWINSLDEIVRASSDDGAKPSGAVSGIYDGLDIPPDDTIAGPAPLSGRQKWLGALWSSPPPPLVAPLTTEELTTQMIKDGTMTQAKIDAIKGAR